MTDSLNQPAEAQKTPLSATTRNAIIGLGITQIIGWGTTYYLLSLLGGPITRELGMPKGAVLAGVSITLIGAAVLGPYTGRWQDRMGSRFVMATGSLIFAIGLTALSKASGPYSYFASWILIAIGTPMALYNAAFTALTQLAGRDSRRAIIYLTFLGGLASTISWPVTAILLGSLDWRGIALIFAGVNLVVCLPLHLILLPSGAALKAGAAAHPVEAGISKAARMPAFLLLAGMLAVNSFIFNCWSLLVFPVLDGLGFDKSVAVSVASFVGICQVLGRMGEMALGGRFSAFQTAMFSVGLLPLSFFVLSFSGGHVAVGFAFAILYGISNGLITIARGALTLAIFGSRGYGERFGKVTFGSGLLGAASPIIGGFALELFGAGILIKALLFTSCVSLALMLLLYRHWQQNRLA